MVDKKKIDKIIKLYKKGTTLKKIAEEVGCSIQTVRKYLKENNVVKDTADTNVEKPVISKPTIVTKSKKKISFFQKILNFFKK